MGDEEVGRQGNLKDIEVDDEGTGLNLEELLGSLDAVEGDGPLVTVSDAGVPVVVAEVLYDELLPDIYDLVDVLGHQVYQLYGKLAGTHSQHLRLLVETDCGN